MKIVIDIEANALENPSKIWVIVCKDLTTGEFHIFRKVTEDAEQRNKFLRFAEGVSLWVGHNLLGYDFPVLNRLIGLDVPNISRSSIDTLIVSKLVDYSRSGHSVEAYGEEFGLPKADFSDFSRYTYEMEEYCRRDVDITEKIYLKYLKYISNKKRLPSIHKEQEFQLEIVNGLTTDGFAFNKTKAEFYLEKITKELEVLDKDILEAFPPKEVLVREFTPKATKYGTISKTSIPRMLWDRIDEYEVGKTYQQTRFEEFNPASHKQIIDVLHDAGWSPIDKTKTHLDTERELNRLKRVRKRSKELDIEIQLCEAKILKLEKYGWKINEINLSTLPAKAPAPARLLAKRILFESRRRTLTEWLGLVKDDGRIHGQFYGIGAWTHRMAHQKPNTANIPNEFDTFDNRKLLGREMRSLWRAPRNRLLVGVDAEGIQLRIFAHYIDDPEFTKALVEGKKDDKTDPHSLNQRILGSVCKSRQAAKRFIYALLLGAGLGKLSEILGCSQSETKEALDRLLLRYTGWAHLKETVIPADARRGFFDGLDGRAVPIPGDTQGLREHLAMSGYLQNGEAIVVKNTTLNTMRRIRAEGLDGILTNIVHDEVIIETSNDVLQAEYISKIFCEEIVKVGQDFGLKCPLAGDGHVGLNWYDIH